MRKFAYYKMVLATSGFGYSWICSCCFTSVDATNVMEKKRENFLPGMFKSQYKSLMKVLEKWGNPVIVPKEDQEKMKEMFKVNKFNLMASEMIALNRSLPDVRLEG